MELNNIFNIQTEQDFLNASLKTFRYQYENVEIYRKFVDFLKVNPAEVDSLVKIPFLPIEMFKNHQILDKNAAADLFFQSSGTTQMNLSKHFIADPDLYEESIYKSFEQFIGKPEDFIFLGLLPSYLEKQNSSLIYMVDYLMKKSAKPENGYFLYNHSELFELLNTLQDKKVILFGVSFALLDFLDYCHSEQSEESLNFQENLVVIETGGMKGRKEEMTKDELLKILQEGLKTDKIYSEYSMTELLSQAYSLGNNEYECPNWMRIMVRNAEDPLAYEKEGRTGAINIIDLANTHSCSFIATQDLGKIVGDKFQVLGRIDHSDIRGCSLLVS
ncbi:phenylacetate-coenzyme A ligase PaaK-like adenylate-forming protein [Chryseobacterium sp. PvR013]|uniref:LuxE/PaaK family acyltransferase n=1 Tax=Chryseobacterium sp. PvR013 TaxID=2806595 RepID=UPI001AEB58DC|nr:acyl transferase [Chryseobacterium sp. PvR013]MBP1167416.1 phenylacetate-coenzyme A ligase PaaK-like adenylate-forming protein [Chryseobacterium sp. PvR013]